jgi:hypothetical protein
MALGDMEHDRPRLEQGKIAFFIGRNLPERMKRSMRGFLHRTERNKTNLVRLAHFFKRPANAHVTRQSLAAIGRPFKGGNGGGHCGAGPAALRFNEGDVWRALLLLSVLPALAVDEPLPLVIRAPIRLTRECLRITA